MSRLIRISSLIQHFGEPLSAVGLTEERLENLVTDGTINGKYDHITGELMMDREAICSYLNISTEPHEEELKLEDELDEMEKYFRETTWDEEADGLD